jgi:molybdate transport system substrate-binding protein
MQSAHEVMSDRRCALTSLACSLAFGVTGSVFAQNAPIRIAAASDLKFALTQLAAQFEGENKLKLAITYGSSGHLARQLEQGLPADLFLSADEALIFRLSKADWAKDEGVVYGRGQLVWMVQKASTAQLDGDLNGLLASLGSAGKLAIANPEHAPYGRAARSALQSLGLLTPLQSRLVLGESVTQATQFVSTGAAAAGLVALSLALAPELAATTRYVTVKPAHYPPIIQRMVLSRSSSVAAQKFFAFLQATASKEVLRANGLGL